MGIAPPAGFEHRAYESQFGFNKRHIMVLNCVVDIRSGDVIHESTDLDLPAILPLEAQASIRKLLQFVWHSRVGLGLQPTLRANP